MKRNTLAVLLVLAFALPISAQLQNGHSITATQSPADATAAIPSTVFQTARERALILPLNYTGSFGDAVSYAVVFQPPSWADACASGGGASDPTVRFTSGGCVSGLNSWAISSYSTYDARETAFAALSDVQKLTAVRWRAVGSNQLDDRRYVLAYQTTSIACQ